MGRRLVTIAVITVALSAVGVVMAASGALADPKTATFTIQLSGAAEVCPTAPGTCGGPGTGTATITIDRNARTLCMRSPPRTWPCRCWPPTSTWRPPGRPARWWSRCSPRTPAKSRFVLIVRGRVECAGRQCLDRRLAGRAILEREVAGWQATGNAPGRGVDWRFKTEDAPIKLRDLLPVFRTDKLLGVPCGRESFRPVVGPSGVASVLSAKTTSARFTSCLHGRHRRSPRVSAGPEDLHPLVAAAWVWSATGTSGHGRVASCW
jgi:hypothetical protein